MSTARPAKKAAPAPSKPSKTASPATLCVDIGGTGIKAIVLDGAGKPLCERERIETPRPATPDAVLSVIDAILAKMPAFDRVSVGFPGVVKRNVVHTAPNLDPTWAGVALGEMLEKRTKKPVRVLNDAGVQGYGAIEGKGTEIMLTLGTGMGCAIFVDGRYVPNVELAHHPLNGKHTYEEHVSDKARKRIGKKKWNKRVREVLEQVQPIFNPDVVYLGGGNAKALVGKLPKNVKVTENIAGLLGGIALWKFGQ